MVDWWSSEEQHCRGWEFNLGWETLEVSLTKQVKKPGILSFAASALTPKLNHSQFIKLTRFVFQGWNSIFLCESVIKKNLPLLHWKGWKKKTSLSPGLQRLHCHFLLRFIELADTQTDVLNLVLTEDPFCRKPLSPVFWLSLHFLLAVRPRRGATQGIPYLIQRTQAPTHKYTLTYT